VCSVDVGSIGRTTYKLLSCDCVRVASQDPEEELAASNLPTSSAPLISVSVTAFDDRKKAKQIFTFSYLEFSPL
jgi:hypothetical protein